MGDKIPGKRLFAGFFLSGKNISLWRPKWTVFCNCLISLYIYVSKTMFSRCFLFLGMEIALF